MQDGSETSAGRARRVAAWALPVLGAAVIGAVVSQAVNRGSKSVLGGDKPYSLRLVTDPAVEFRGDPEWQNYRFVMPDRRRLAGRPPRMCRQWYTWAHRRGAQDADLTEAYLTIQGRPDTAILIEEVRAEIVKRDPVPAGAQGVCMAPGGAESSPRLVDVNLDMRPPAVLLADVGDDFPQRGQLHLTLNGTETEELVIRAHTRTCDCRWRLYLQMVVNGKERDEVIDRDGEPFRTTASTASTHFAWTGQGWAHMSRQAWLDSRPMVWQDQGLPGEQ